MTTPHSDDLSIPFRAAFRCIANCPGEHSLESIMYRCPTCGDLLEVVHDGDPLARLSGEEWRARFDARYCTPTGISSSGVWGKREWVAPHIEEEHIVSLGEGGTHMVRASRCAREFGIGELWVKQCGNSHTGSFKDLGMTVLVSAVKQMIARGAAIPAIVCASTGDTSAALAAYAAAAGIRTVVVLPRGKISNEQLVQPLASGAAALAVDTDFDGCMKLVIELAEKDNFYLANSMNSLRLEGQKTVIVEIIQQLGWRVPDWVVIPGGNLGNASALGAGLRMMRDLGVIDRVPRICVAQAQAANPLYRSFQTGFDRFEAIEAQPTLASAIRIGAPVSRDKAIRAVREFDGVVEQATEMELAEAAARADRAGLFCCPHTGVALACTEKLARTGTIRPDDEVVVISTANGLKFSGFKALYHGSRLEAVPSPQNANPQIELAADYEAVRRAALGAVGA